MNAPTRVFTATEAVREEVPLLIGLLGPPGGGKTFSALRLAAGIQRVRGGDVIVIDTERRAQKYAGQFKFKRVAFDPPFRPSDFLAAVEQQVPSNPAAIIIDSASDEHEGAGGVLDWHDTELDRMAGSDWSKRERMTQAAWIKPKRDRINMINGLTRVTVPMLFCFRAREKTKQIKDDKGRMVPTNIGYQPIAPSEIVHAMDLTCILPPRAEGVPVWKSDRAGEDFIIKLPEYLKPFITEGQPLSEAMGEAFARWARGGAPSPSRAAPASDASRSPPDPEAGAATDLPWASWSEYVEVWKAMLDEATDAAQLGAAWNSQGHKDARAQLGSDEQRADLMERVSAKIAALKRALTTRERD